MKKTYDRILTFFKYRELFIQLVIREIKIKYRKSILGYLWSVLNPLLTMIVLIIVFSNMFARGVPNFPVYLLTGQLLFNFMVISTSRSLSSVVGNASLLKKIYVPKYIFTFSVVTSELITYLFSLGALLVVILFTGAPVTWRYIFIIIPIVELYVFCIGIGLFLAQVYVFFRDVEYIWSVITTAWLYLSAIFYPVSVLPGKIYFLVTNLNPMYFYITIFRNFTIGGDNSGNFELIIRGAVTSVLALFLGLISFSYSKKKFILYM